MKLIGWNCQGLGRPSTIRSLYNLLKAENPDILFIMETKSKKAAIEKIARKRNFQNFSTVDPIGTSGGLALLWKDTVTLSVLTAETNFIDAEVTSVDSPAFYLTCVYGDPVRHRRRVVWDRISALNHQGSRWLCYGDFNSYLSWHEKEGGARSTSHDGEIFRDFLSSCDFLDLGFNGSVFTWNNRRKGAANIRIRLDRALCNAAWRQVFDNASIFVKPAVCSDHCPILVDTEGGIVRGKRPFRFESMWTLHEDCKNAASRAWSIPVSGPASKQTLLKIAHCKEVYKKWNAEVFGNIYESIKSIKDELSHIQGLPSSLYSQERESELQKLLDVQLQREEEMWRQKSRLDWIKGGDKNTSFFHVTTLRRRHRNMILKLKAPSGEWSFSPTEVSNILCNHFQDLYSSEPINNNALTSVLDAVQPVVTDELNLTLCSAPREEEIRAALFRMAPLKSQGPDGLPPIFFQKYWEMVKVDLVALVEEFFSMGQIPKDLNKTFICLIPKVNAPDCAEQFRPISLCNIAFKIITKLIADRLSGALDQIISPSQSAFIPNRLISDNVLVAHELFHYIKKQKKGKEKFLALKGIRQGDPISPAIFILCSQALSAVIKKAEVEGNIKGVRVRHRSEPITHLLFADDCLLFSRINLQEVNSLKDCLDLYCNATGQAINLKKSSLTFSPNTHDRIKRWFSRILKVKNGDGPAKYLGLPTHFGVAKKDVFNDIKERTLSKLQGWKGKLLSHAGKEVLIKSAVAPMGDSEENKRVHWMSWQRLCKPKSRGGLGFKDSKFQNRALLAKVAWRLWSSPNSHWAKFLKSIYFPQCDFLDARVGNLPSWGWRSLLVGREVLLEGLIWRVGNGEKIRIWEDRWVPSLPNGRLQSLEPEGCSLIVVADLIDQDNRSWNVNLLHSLFSASDVAAILKIPLSLNPAEDKRYWSASRDGRFSVKSTYKLLIKKEEEEASARASSSRYRLWEHTPEERVCNEAIASGDGLKARQINIDSSCSRCGAHSELGDHILFDYPFARSVWFGSPLQFHPPVDGPCLKDWIQSWNIWFKQDKKIATESLSRASFICWYLWCVRNDQVFNGKVWTPLDVLHTAEMAYQEFFNAALKSNALSETGVIGSMPGSRFNGSQWSPPPVGVVKVDCDAAFIKDTAKGGLGVIFRDHTGAVLRARSIPIMLSSVIHGEIMAIRSALLLALDLGYKNLVVVSDSRDAILFIEGSKSPSWEMEGLVDDVVNLKSSFSSISFSFVPRAMNIVSDALARKALSLGCVTDWPNSIRWLQDLYGNEVTGCTPLFHQ
ncbi:uncharacterized protein LOC122665544 [Telopea speciosissima]|uniref:uncharacterized protein LOC122665544 n=1 Tax=Telopea speciosissima TaxID=54955 RepID=UPI001CC49727|nr:uncharacterized protein LOC122665544 [Telopea speciosissima]